MTTSAAFTPDEWKQVLQGPPIAGTIIVTADHGGMFREAMAMSKVYAEARRDHGESELLDGIVSAKPQLDHTRYKTPEELRSSGLDHLRQAVALVAAKATTEELGEYRKFVLTLATRVASAHKEHGVAVSPAEAEAVQEITRALGLPGS
jgi:hypothetical protein